MNMNRFTKSVGLVAKVALVGRVVLVVGSVALLGAACWKGVGTNTNVGVGNGNVGVNENANFNTNSNTNSTDKIDTSNWSTYTNEEYKFSVDIKDEWVLKMTESLTWESRITSGPAIAIQWKEEDQIYLNIFPDGGFDGGSLCVPIEQKSIFVETKNAKVHYCTDKTYVFFEDYPNKTNGTFRVVINASFHEERASIEHIIGSLVIF